jgi:hypothetical protein
MTGREIDRGPRVKVRLLKVRAQHFLTRSGTVTAVPPTPTGE